MIAWVDEYCRPDYRPDPWTKSYSRGYPCQHSWWPLWRKDRVYAGELRVITLHQCRYCRDERVRVSP